MASNFNQRYGSSGSNRGGSRRSVSAARARTSAPSARARASASSDPRNVRRGSVSPAGSRASADSKISSTRIGDINRTVTKGRARRGKKKAYIIIGLVAFLLVAAVVAFVVLSHTSTFKIEKIDVVGVEHLTDDEMSQLAEVPDGATLLNVDTEAIRKNLLRDAWVKDASINRIFPNTLQLAVTERTIQAVVEVQENGESDVVPWAIASDGMWLMPIPDEDSDAGKATSEKVYEDAENVMHIEDVMVSEEPEIGTTCQVASVNNALAIVEGMSTELADQVKTVIASEAQSTTLILENGVEIAFGDSEDIRDKERVCLEIMNEHKDAVAYINVRTVDRPTWRSL